MHQWSIPCLLLNCPTATQAPGWPVLGDDVAPGNNSDPLLLVVVLGVVVVVVLVVSVVSSLA